MTVFSKHELSYLALWTGAILNIAVVLFIYTSFKPYEKLRVEICQQRMMLFVYNNDKQFVFIDAV